MTIKAAFFDVGDTLVEHWAPREEVSERMRAQICAELGEPRWLDDLVATDLEPVAPTSLAHVLAAGDKGARLAPEWSRQETERWLRAWFEEHGHATDGVDLDRLRTLMCVALADVSTPVPGAFEALKWCAQKGLRVVLVTNTLTRGDAEVLDDWNRFGLGDAIYGVVSSHSAGWRKPHPSIFERALEIAEIDAAAAFHVGDNLITDVYGAQQLGLKAVWRRKPTSVAEGRRSERTASDGADCRHPSDFLTIRGGRGFCGSCERTLDIEIRPDAIIDDLTELPALVSGWLR